MIKHLEVSHAVLEYVRNHSLRESDTLQALRDTTANMPEKNMQVLPEQAQFLSLLIQATGAKRAIEVGVFTGYNALCTAIALPKDGMLVACDNNEAWLEIAKSFWDKAGVSDKIQVKTGDAVRTLENLIATEGESSFDFVFIDADKENYNSYYESALKLVRQGGLIAIDNTLWSGTVADPSMSDPEIDALRALNEKIHHDERVNLSMLPFADGVTLAYKR